MKSSSPTKPIYGSLIEGVARGLATAQAAKRAKAPEDYDRTSRKDFWNDPERWDGIDDTHKTMIWEVRRPDRIDVGGNEVDENAVRAVMAKQKASYDLARLQLLNQSNAAIGGLYNYRRQPSFVGWLFGY